MKNGIGMLAFIFVLIASSTWSCAAASQDNGSMASSFEEFGKAWMSKLDKVGKENRTQLQLKRDGNIYIGSYRCYGPECELTVKPTDSKVSPFVGLIRYIEKEIEQRGASREEALNAEGKVVSEVPVTEIFRFTKGKWIY